MAQPCRWAAATRAGLPATATVPASAGGSKSQIGWGQWYQATSQSQTVPVATLKHPLRNVNRMGINQSHNVMISTVTADITSRLAKPWRSYGLMAQRNKTAPIRHPVSMRPSAPAPTTLTQQLCNSSETGSPRSPT